MWLYLFLLLLSVAAPLALSFDSKLHFYRQWTVVLPSISVVAAVYLAFDIWFTHKGVWGFNPAYHLTFFILGLPLEEWLFFILIPYASLFVHYAFFLYYPNAHLRPQAGKLLTVLFLISIALILSFYYEKMYTVYVLGMLAIGFLVSFFDKSRVIDKLYVSFLIILFPFLLVNGILTGSFIPAEVVWYNSQEIIGLRIFTIPIEDVAYGFSMLLFNVLIIEYLTAKYMARRYA